MIKGMGIDIVKVEFVEEMLDKYGEQFLLAHYSEKEISFFHAKKRNGIQFLAGRFAAKEAFYKAISNSGDTSAEDLDFMDIEILNNEKGCPFLNFACPVPKDMGGFINEIYVSISHHGEYAVAAVILESSGR